MNYIFYKLFNSDNVKKITHLTKKNNNIKIITGISLCLFTLKLIHSSESNNQVKSTLKQDKDKDRYIQFEKYKYND